MSTSDAPKTPRAAAAQHRAATADVVARPTIERNAPQVELRLAIARAGVGLELSRTATLGCLQVSELSIRLPAMRFPIDVSGGVARFRHRRGTLERCTVELDARALEAWAAPRLRGLLGTGTPRVWVAMRRGGATVCLSEIGDVTQGTPSPRVLAFDVLLEPRGEDVGLLVTNARGIGLPRPATAAALSAMEALLSGMADRKGARFSVRALAARVARNLLPDAGARVPDARGVSVSALGAHDATWIVQASRGAPPLAVDEATLRATEAAALTELADEARIAGDFTRARALDLAALERAPRHPEICRRIAEIDAHVGGRAEAAVLTLREAEPSPTAVTSLLLGELLTEVGDARGAVAAFAAAGEADAAPALAAHAYRRAAELSADPLDALIWLDRAVSRAPSDASLRWARIGRRLDLGQIEAAHGDVEHLEAIADGTRDKHAVWRRAGEAWKAAGLVEEAAASFERALRYAPDDPVSLGGLGTALARAGRPARGAALLSRAIELAETARHDTAQMLLDLAHVLADSLGDLPAAVARVRAIGNASPHAFSARGLEGRYRAKMGDLAGASLAFARLRELSSTLDGKGPSAEVAVPFLLEAARFEETVAEDLLAAQRHLSCALRLRPHDRGAQDAYRAVGLRLAGKAPPAAEPPAAPAAVAEPAAVVAAPPAASRDYPAVDDEARVEELTRALQANPEDDAVVDELVVRLSRLGRALDLFALLSARLEDAPPDRRERLLPRQREVLERLEKTARDEGRAMEAELFESARLAL